MQTQKSSDQTQKKSSEHHSNKPKKKSPKTQIEIGTPWPKNHPRPKDHPRPKNHLTKPKNKSFVAEPRTLLTTRVEIGAPPVTTSCWDRRSTTLCRDRRLRWVSVGFLKWPKKKWVCEMEREWWKYGFVRWVFWDWRRNGFVRDSGFWDWGRNGERGERVRARGEREKGPIGWRWERERERGERK